MRLPAVSRTSLLLVVLLSSLSVYAQRTGAKKPTPPAKPAAEPAAKPCPFARPDDPYHRIILRDGNYQLAGKCEIIGERVHYMSTERSEWEDLPASLVDWDETNKYELGQLTPKKSAEAAALDAEEEAERKLEAEKSPEIKPGLRLPGQGGIFLLDYWRDNPELVELVQNGGQLNANRKSNILRAAVNPLSKARQTIEIKGTRAQVQSHVPQPRIFVNIDLDQDSRGVARDLSDHFRIVRATQKKDARVVGALEIAVYGKVTQKASFVPTQTTALNSQWLEVVPAQPLDPGEYALVEMLGKDVNMYVWDFGVSPTAPENATAWKPAPVRETQTGTRDVPVLDKRPPRN